MESDKMIYDIYVDLKSLIKTIDGCANNPEKPSRTKISACWYSVSTIRAFDNIENKHSMNIFYITLKKHVTNVTNFDLIYLVEFLQFFTADQITTIILSLKN